MHKTKKHSSELGAFSYLYIYSWGEQDFASQHPQSVALKINQTKKHSSELGAFLLLIYLWGEQDSNLRRLSQRIYSPPSLAA